MSNLQPIDPMSLAEKVYDAVTTFIAAKKPFTAYDITVALRKLNPTTNIEHNPVRISVHTALQPYLKSADYSAHLKSFPKGDAWMYSPAATLPKRMFQVESTVVKEFGYLNGNLFIRFHDGSLYQYSDVPETMVMQIMQAESVGTFFNTHIKNEFDSLHLE